VRIFADEGTPMAILLSRLIAAQRTRQGTARSVQFGCLGRLVRAFEQDTAVTSPRARSSNAVSLAWSSR
jgi:hypothetical protein